MSLLRRGVCAVLLLAGVSTLPAQAAEVHSTEAGQRIYREGILPSGLPLHATVEQDVALVGARAACINCHRRSGYGATEGNRIVPPVRAGYLFGNLSSGNPAQRGQLSERSSLPTSYDPATFKRALREGMHFSGRPLSALMPRYVLTDADLDLLVDYLRTLSDDAPPGVTDKEIHFATIVTEGVPKAQRHALLSVMNAFFEKQNAERAKSTSLTVRTALGHGRLYRAIHQWRLHVWELKGAPESWPGQMDRYYREQPVYAVIGGVGRGEWQTIHAHCERLTLPCLFPNPEHLETIDNDFFSVYFTRGIAQEAELLAHTLLKQPRDKPQRILQIYRGHDSGALAAQSLRHALAGAQQFEFHHYDLDSMSGDDTAFWKLLPAEQNTILVLWLRPEDLAQLPNLAGTDAALYLSGTLLGQSTEVIPVPLRRQTRVLFLHELPAHWQDRRKRVAALLASYGLPLQDERIQTNTLVALTLVSRVLTHMRENLARELLIERIEHTVQSSSWSSPYPQLSLGPGQRVASRGGFQLRLQDDGSYPAQGEWIVPEAVARQFDGTGLLQPSAQVIQPKTF